MNTLEQTSPRAVSAPDGDIANLPRYLCEGTGVIRVGAISTVARATLSLRVVFYDATGIVAGVSSTVLFTADAAADFGGKFLATPVPDAYFPTGGATSFSIAVLALSGGTWTVNPLAY